MKIEYVGRDYNVSDSLKKVTETKSTKLSKFLNDDATIKYTIIKIGDSYTTELTANYKGQLIKAEATSSDPFSNVDIVIPKFEGQARKFKTADEKGKRGWQKTYPEMGTRIETELTDEDK